MAKLPNGILGRIAGKVGPVIGATWRRIPYVRSYAKPSTALTSFQEDWRIFFAAVINACKLIKGTVVDRYWDPFFPRTGGWAGITQYNLRNMAAPFNYQDFVPADGKLSGATVNSCVYNPTTGQLQITWNPTLAGNGTDEDWSAFLCIDTANNVAFFDYGTNRDEATSTMQIGPDRLYSELRAWLFFSNPDDIVRAVSHSEFVQPTL